MEYDGGAQAPTPARFDGARHVWPGQPGYETSAVVPAPVAPEAIEPPAAEVDSARWEDDGGAPEPIDAEA